MRSVQALMATAVLAASAGTARADWQYTSWGMTPAEVVAASHDVAHDNADRTLDVTGLRAELTAPYEAVALPFTAVFLFNGEDRLQYVTLKPVGGIACPVLVQALGARYGEPEGRVDMVHATTLRWDDAERDNLVVYLDLGHGNCSVQFSHLPLTQPDGKGL